MNDEQLKSLEALLEWATQANRRLEFERDRETGFQFGGNPYSNPTFKVAGTVLSELRAKLEDEERETMEEGDSRYYFRLQRSGLVWGPSPYFFVDTADGRRQGNLSGTALALMDEWARTGERTAWLVMLDRIQESPEEVLGLAPAEVLAGIDWLRNH
jgi:hypothetical protein